MHELQLNSCKMVNKLRTKKIIYSTIFFLHGYIREIRDKLQLCLFIMSILDSPHPPPLCKSK